jgi:hypothetical protein
VGRNPLHLRHKLLKERVRIKLGRFEIVNLIVTKILMFTVWPVVLGVYDRNPVYRSHTTATVGTCQQVQRLIGTVNASDFRAAESPFQFTSHSKDRFAPVRRVAVAEWQTPPERYS